ncbi:MAG: outer membrane protein transport protein [Candidatus Auribacterota bacterium]|nr:outer membrane protein transport protein [Candidatus Auribacterota bacterium]
MNKFFSFIVCVSIIGSLFILHASDTSAAGFALLEQSGKGLGEAFAGGRTDTESPSSIFYNPAAMAFMEKNGIGLAFSAIDVSMKFKDDGSRTVTGAPLTGGNGGNGGTLGLVPGLSYVQKLVDRVTIGLAINAPFGLATKYADDWKGRYHGVETDLAVISISPTVAYELLPEFLSLGGSLNIEYAEAKLTNAIDFGTILMAGGTTPQTLDGFADMNGDDWAVGYSLGLLCTITPDTRIGISYRSKTDHNFRGDVDFDVPTAARAGLDSIGLTNYFIDTDANASITLPESLSCGIYQQLGQYFAVMGDVSWTNWRRFKKLVANFDSGQAPSVTEEQWEDSMAYRLGINYFASQELTLRAGTAYDEAAVKTAYRTPRIPDNDRVWLTLGLTYAFSDDLKVDLGYAHLFINDCDSKLTNTPVAGNLMGKYEASIDIYAIEGTLLF